MNLLRPTKKGQLTNYCLFLTSRWFETIEDFIHVEIGCKRFLGNLTKFFYNPLSLNKQTREFFPNLQTLYIYNKSDKLFKTDKRIQRRIIQICPYYLTYKQIKQLEEWTTFSCKEILFDSFTDSWKKKKSIVNECIIGKKHVLFLIEDEQKEVFGYYLDTEIQEKYDEWISTNSQSFHFNLESNGRLEKPMKFERKNTRWGYKLWNNSEDWLIWLGDIALRPEQKKHKSLCYQPDDNFHYHNIEKALCGKEYLLSEESFTPKHILIIQMY